MMARYHQRLEGFNLHKMLYIFHWHSVLKHVATRLSAFFRYGKRLQAVTLLYRHAVF